MDSLNSTKLLAAARMKDHVDATESSGATVGISDAVGVTFGEAVKTYRRNSNAREAYRNAAGNLIPDAKAAFGPTASALGASFKKEWGKITVA